jgi:hypothetical protein
MKSPWNHPFSQGFPMFFREISPFSYGFPMVFLWFHHFPMGFLMFPVVPRPKTPGFSQAYNGRRRPQSAAAHGLGRASGAERRGRCEPWRSTGPTGDDRWMGRKEWRNHRKAIGKWWNHRKTIGNP